uniref:NADH-ubiquinone oxidoreductase chain 4L n=1 Tax=Plectrocnemia tortosa TaxID=623669 RepID=A0A9E8LP78_9NEOP|nr:NADH dehydrogenase subunit 4L [Plectrocnemia tortosa]UZZ44271.1 NADH dehydrogenase subunit 4L [Plectrocnemia tortosa]
MLFIFCYLMMFFLGGLSFIFQQKHLLLLLMALEFMMLSMLMLMFFYLMSMWNDLFMYVCFLVMMVIESVLGLNLLILMIRFSGNDYYFSFNLLMC